MKKFLLIYLILIVLLGFNRCKDSANDIQENPNKTDTTLKMTFIELGSVNCIPCQKMRPVMDSIQKKYGNQILVKFIDVIKNSKEAEPYKIKVMPTQVFLDSNNVEVHRHENFYPEDSIHIFLKSIGLKIINN